MATTLTSGCSASIRWSYTSSLAWGGPSDSAGYSYSNSMANGTGAAQADLVYILDTTLAAGATLNVDLAGTVTNVFGTTLTFARVKVIYLELLDDTTASSVLLGGHATAALANWITSADTLDNDQPKVRVRNGGVFLLSAPDATAYVVTATTEDLLTLTNADGSNIATYRLVIIGSSA